MLILIFLPTALATWSIIAVDPETGDVGATGATCGHMVGMIGEVVPDQ